ncbi:MAG: hypothetical protein V3S01_08300 [Dehalococcoidia bacterium]
MPIPGATDPASCTQQGGTWQALPPPAPPGMGVCLSGAIPAVPGVPGGFPAPPPQFKPAIPGYTTNEACSAAQADAALKHRGAAEALRKRGIYMSVVALGVGLIIGVVAGKKRK